MTWWIDGRLSMYYLEVALFRQFTMARERRKRVKHLSRGLRKIVMEKHPCFSVMDGHHLQRYLPTPIVMKNPSPTVAVVVHVKPFGLSMRS